MIRRQLMEIVKERIRLIRFAIVGGSGVLVNAGIFELSYALLETQVSESVRMNTSALLGFAVSFTTNFLANNFWTWGDRQQEAQLTFSRRFAAYFAVAGSALIVQLVVLNLLSSLMEPRWANIIGIGAGTIVNFTINHLWTFRTGSKPRE